jgi:tetraacyldisaccharide 4'-kinase
LNPLSAIYGAVTSGRNHLYDRGRLPIHKLRGPVVSVGNLSTGGAGKTPFVMLLGEQLKMRGVPFDILSRGYGRQSRGVRLVDPEGSAAEYGDEPLLLARRLHVPVFVGESRFAGGLAAEKKFGPQLHLLDDGFQHRALARDFDIVLLSSRDAADQLLPAGRLREPLSSLMRAHAVVLTNKPRIHKNPTTEATTNATTPCAPPSKQFLWRVRRGIRLENPPPRPIVFCGVARPQNFFEQLRHAGVEPSAEIPYRDHHAYSENDIHELMGLRTQHAAGGFLTTEKDAINLGGHTASLAPLSIVPVTMEFDEPVDAVDTMLRIVDEHRHRS